MLVISADHAGPKTKHHVCEPMHQAVNGEVSSESITLDGTMCPG